MCILLPVTDKCPSWISGKGRVIAEMSSWSTSMKVTWLRWNSNLRLLDLLSDVLPFKKGSTLTGKNLSPLRYIHIPELKLPTLAKLVTSPTSKETNFQSVCPFICWFCPNLSLSEISCFSKDPSSFYDLSFFFTKVCCLCFITPQF